MSNIYLPPAADLSAGMPAEDSYLPSMFALRGRIGRMRLLAYGLVGNLILYVATVICVVILVLIEKMQSGLMAWLPAAMALAGLAWGGILATRRLHDLDLRAWWCLVLLIPILNLLLALCLCFVRGKQGANDYGPAPSKNPLWIVICAWLTPFLLLGFVALVVIQYQASAAGLSGTSATVR